MARIIYGWNRYHAQTDSKTQILMIPAKVQLPGDPLMTSTWRGEPIAALWEEADGLWIRQM